MIEQMAGTQTLAEQQNYTCYDVLQDLDGVMRDSLPAGTGYFLLGGIATDAIKHPGSVLDTESQTVVTAKAADSGVIRPNGTRRDADILVNTVLDDEAAERVKAGVAEALGHQLLVSVFGFDRRSEKLRFTQRLTDFTSRRTVDDQGVLRYELYPLEQTVPGESYEPWKLHLPSGSLVTMFNPIGHMLAYRMRSISGLRVKDATKFHEMAVRVTQVPELREEMLDGAFRSWYDFAEAIAAAGRYGEFSSDNLMQGAGEAAALGFRVKSRLLHTLESSPLLVKLAQTDLMQSGPLKAFVHSK